MCNPIPYLAQTPSFFPHYKHNPAHNQSLSYSSIIRTFQNAICIWVKFRGVKMRYIPTLVWSIIILHTLSAEVFIRTNQIGYTTGESKRAIICALNNEQINGIPFFLYRGVELIFEGVTGGARSTEGTPFTSISEMDFSSLRENGEYRLEIAGGTVSDNFKIGATAEYKEIYSSLLRFYQSQRCGNTNPIMHGPCHLNDSLAEVDVSGGWHDAGDYIKFMVPTSFVTLNLLTALEYGQDFMSEHGLIDERETNGVPDLAEEARIGIEWMLKMSSGYADNKFFIQVSDSLDHDFWRLPETDDESGDVGNPRTVHEGWGSNLNGRSIAAFAMASRLYTTYDPIFAALCLERAKALWLIRKNYLDFSPKVDYYIENKGDDDMLLAAIEMYRTTNEEEYKNYASKNISNASEGSLTWAGCEFLSIAAAARAGIKKDESIEKMRKIITSFRDNSNEHPMGLSSGMVWGTTAEFTSQAQMAIMYYYLTDDAKFLPMAERQKDYLLGTNNWGTTFIVGAGNRYPKNAHSQINDLVGLQVGAVVGGPTSVNNYSGQKWLNGELANFKDPYLKLQANEVYYDCKSDYISNEVAIDYASSAVFMMMHTYSYGMKKSITNMENETSGIELVQMKSRKAMGKSKKVDGYTLSLSKGDMICEVGIYSLAGKKVVTLSNSKPQTEVALNSSDLNLSTGIYLLEVRGEKQSYSTKISLF
jgi:endoglucanase